MTRQAFIAERLTEERSYAGVDALAGKYLESVLPTCNEEESWRIDALLHHAAMLSPAASANPSQAKEQAA